MIDDKYLEELARGNIPEDLEGLVFKPLTFFWFGELGCSVVVSYKRVLYHLQWTEGSSIKKDDDIWNLRISKINSKILKSIEAEYKTL
jgi:hypothetical protein